MSNTLGSLPFSHLDDDNFRVTLFELNNGPINLDPERLACVAAGCVTKSRYRRSCLSVTQATRGLIV